MTSTANSFDASRKFEYQLIHFDDFPALQLQFPNRNFLLRIDGRLGKVYQENPHGLIHYGDGSVQELSDFTTNPLIECAVERYMLFRLGMETFNGIDTSVIKSWRYDPDDV